MIPPCALFHPIGQLHILAVESKLSLFHLRFAVSHHPVWIEKQDGATQVSNEKAVTLSERTSTTCAVAALATFRSFITSDPNNRLTSWAGENPCLYQGIACGTLASVPGQGARSDVEEV